jgi:hypothetical protein
MITEKTAACHDSCKFLAAGAHMPDTLAHPLLGCIPEDLEGSITSTLWKEMGVTSSVTKNLE